MNISMDKKYTLDGEDFTVWTVEKPGKRCVAGHTPDGNMYSFYADGMWEGKSRLIEVSPYADFKIDEPVMVRDSGNQSWGRGFFGGVSNEKPFVWSFGATKWSSGNDRTYWNQCRRPTAEELAT